MGTNVKIDALPNIGPKLAKALREVGVPDSETLRAQGAEPVWRKLRAAGLFDCAMSLQALEGAVQGMRWHDLDKVTRARLVSIANNPDMGDTVTSLSSRRTDAASGVVPAIPGQVSPSVAASPL